MSKGHGIKGLARAIGVEPRSPGSKATPGGKPKPQSTPKSAPTASGKGRKGRKSNILTGKDKLG